MLHILPFCILIDNEIEGGNIMDLPGKQFIWTRVEGGWYISHSAVVEGKYHVIHWIKREQTIGGEKLKEKKVWVDGRSPRLVGNRDGGLIAQGLFSLLWEWLCKCGILANWALVAQTKLVSLGSLSTSKHLEMFYSCYFCIQLLEVLQSFQFNILGLYFLTAFLNSIQLGVLLFS